MTSRTLLIQFAIWFGFLAHIFCCGLPALLAITSLFGASLPLVSESFIHRYEFPLFLFSLLAIAVVLFVEIRKYFINKHNNFESDSCEKHCHAPPRLWVIFLALLALALNTATITGLIHFH